MFLSKNCKKWFETYRASFISVCAMVLLLIAAVFCHLFGWKDAPFQFLAACLGAGVTVIITNLLLVEQTKQQGELQKEEAKAQSDLQDKVKAQNLEQAKKTEQYKEKLRIYQKFLEELYTVVKDRDLSTEEKINMQFQTAYLAIHTDVGRIEEVSANLKDIIDCLISPSGNNYDVDRLQQALFNIVRQFREELYEEKVSVGDDYTAIINNFVKAFSPDGDDNNTGNDASLWSEACTRWKEDKKWEMSVNGETIRLHRPDNKEIHVQFGFWEGHYYIQAKYQGFSDFSKELKWKYKGRKTYETWWKHIESTLFHGLKEGEFWDKFTADEAMQKELVKWFDDLILFIDGWDIPAGRYKTLMGIIDRAAYERKGWAFWVYDSRCIVCDSHLKDLGEPFIDTYYDESIGKITVRLGNRKNDENVQRMILERIGLPTAEIREDNRTDYRTFEADAKDDDIMSAAAELMEKIAKA